MSAKTRVAFVGAGGIAESHLQGLSKHPDVALVAFCDIKKARAEQVAGRYGARAFTDAKKMFDRVRMDAVFFCLPPFAHGAEMEAVERGIPFFVEKPAHLDLAGARQIAKAVAKNTLLTTVGYMNRYRRPINTVRDLLASDPAILVTGGWIGGTPGAGSGDGIWSWWIQKDKSGGQFHEQVTHTVDLVRYLCGEVVDVHALAATGLNRKAPLKYSIEDAAVVNLRLANGGVANLWASCSANAGGGGVSLNVYAHGLTAKYTGWEHTLRLMRTGQDTIEIAGEPDIFAIEDTAFIKAVREQDPSHVRSSYEDGLKAIEITLAANQSMETGRPVRIK